MADPARARKLADRIREVAAETLERQVKDPRLGFVTVTEARLTNDLREATIFFTVLGDDAAVADTAAALDSARGLVRSAIGRATGIRHTPSVAWVHDKLPDDARHIEDLLARARAADAEVERARVGAEPAGDPDPYRTPVSDAAPDAAAASDDGSAR